MKCIPLVVREKLHESTENNLNLYFYFINVCKNTENHIFLIQCIEFYILCKYYLLSNILSF